MTRKDYELIVGALVAARKAVLNPTERSAVVRDAAGAAVDIVATILADRLAKDNPRFDGTRFFNVYDKED